MTRTDAGAPPDTRRHLCEGRTTNPPVTGGGKGSGELTDPGRLLAGIFTPAHPHLAMREESFALARDLDHLALCRPAGAFGVVEQRVVEARLRLGALLLKFRNAALDFWQRAEPWHHAAVVTIRVRAD